MSDNKPLPSSSLTPQNYENIREKFAFAPKKTVYNFFPHLKKSSIDDTLSKSVVFTRFKQHRKPKVYVPIYGELIYQLSIKV